MPRLPALLLYLFFCTCVPALSLAGPGGAAAGASTGTKAVASPPLEEENDAVIGRIRVVDHLGRPHFKVKTATATYFYDPAAGGFSAIFDKLGHDWVAYQDDPDPAYPAAAATSYRGVPNLVHLGADRGVGHPGFRKCESRITRRNEITTVSLSGAWEWRWTFYRNVAKLEILKAPADQAYWFLYEGPVGGKYRPRSTFWATDLSAPSYTIHDHYAEDAYRAQHRYFFFGEDQRNFVLFMAQATPDVHQDHLSYLGSEEIGARDSPDGMMVAGFGRAAGATPLLKGKNVFLLGLTRHTPADPIATSRTRRRIAKIIRRRAPVRAARKR